MNIQAKDKADLETVAQPLPLQLLQAPTIPQAKMITEETRHYLEIKEENKQIRATLEQILQLQQIIISNQRHLEQQSQTALFSELLLRSPMSSSA